MKQNQPNEQDQQARPKKQDYYTIDLQHIGRALLHRVWIILLVGILVGGVAFSWAFFLIEPSYSSSVQLYVNNKDATDQSSSISASQIAAAQDLVKTYSVILQSRTTMEEIIAEGQFPYDATELSGMISSGAVNNTEVLRVTVTAQDPQKACDIANAVAVVLPERIKAVIDGAEMRLVESPQVNTRKVAPSVTKYTVLGGLLGVLISAFVLAIVAVLDDRIHDEEYIFRTYDYPILAKVPNLTGQRSKHRYGYYSQHKEK